MTGQWQSSKPFSNYQIWRQSRYTCNTEIQKRNVPACTHQIRLCNIPMYPCNKSAVLTKTRLRGEFIANSLTIRIQLFPCIRTIRYSVHVLTTRRTTSFAVRIILTNFTTFVKILCNLRHFYNMFLRPFILAVLMHIWRHFGDFFQEFYVFLEKFEFWSNQALFGYLFGCSFFNLLLL